VSFHSMAAHPPAVHYASPAVPSVEVKKVDKQEAKKAVKKFLDGESMMDREREIDRVMAAFKLNPFEILNVRTDATSQEVKKQYRELSRLVHPDKCRKEIRETAQKAFAKLATAKTDLLDEKKREDLNKIVYEARTRLVERLQRDIRTKRKEEAKAAKARGEEPPEKEPLPDVTRMIPNWDDLVKAETKEVLIEKAWSQKQGQKAAEEEDKRIAKEKEEIDKKRKQDEEDKKKWDEGRDHRVNDWRNFMKGGTGKKKKKRSLNMPKMYQTDGDKTYIKRVKK